MNYLFILFCTVALASAIEVKDCGSKSGSYSKVNITGCDSLAVCILKRNSNVSITFDFIPTKDVSSIKAVVHGVIDGIPVPYHIPNSNACVDSGVTCPVKSGTLQQYAATFGVLKNYPKIHVKVRWELQNESGEDIICMEIPTQIK